MRFAIFSLLSLFSTFALAIPRPTPLPEPSALALLGIVGAAIYLTGRKKRK